ncbi:hypothetical protein BJX64DRAFT_19797 [Aspergillus heterothallicus]
MYHPCLTRMDPISVSASEGAIASRLFSFFPLLPNYLFPGICFSCNTVSYFSFSYYLFDVIFPLTWSDRNFFTQQRCCRVPSSWMVRRAFPWTTKTPIDEVVLLATLWRHPSPYLPPTACDTTHNSLRCRIYRKLSSDLGHPRLQPLVTSLSSALETLG